MVEQASLDHQNEIQIPKQKEMQDLEDKSPLNKLKSFDDDVNCFFPITLRTEICLNVSRLIFSR